MGWMRKTESRVAAWLLLLGASASAQGRTITVGLGGEYDFGTIQGAINDSTDGDVIVIADGLYRGDGNRDIDFMGRAIVLRSENGPQSCIVDCNGSEREPHRGFFFHNAEDSDSLLEGLTIRGGFAVPCGGAIYCRQSNPTVMNCIMAENTAVAIGGGIFNELASPTMVGCTLLGNYSENGGGMANATAEPQLTNCRLIGNSAKGSGGGIYSVLGKMTLVNCTLRGNQARSGGGMLNHRSSPRLANCAFLGNSAESGGGLLNYGGESFISGCVFSGNTADGGAGIYSSYGRAVLVCCTFAGNQATWAGGMENYASVVELSRCNFSSNRAKWGGGLRLYAGSATLAHCIFSGNFARTGAGIYTRDGTELDMANCTFAGNWGGGGNAVTCASDRQKQPSRIDIGSSILWDRGEEILSEDESKIVIVYSIVRGGQPGEGNMDEDPCFAGGGYWDWNGTADDANDDFWVEGDYHLQSQAGRWNSGEGRWVRDNVTSPGIDSGDPGAAVGSEPFPNGGRLNMGAYGGTAEASRSHFTDVVCETVLAGDINGDCRVDFADFALIATHWVER